MASKQQRVPEGMHLVDMGIMGQGMVDHTPDVDEAYTIYTTINRKGGCEYAKECISCPFPVCAEESEVTGNFDTYIRRLLVQNLYRKGVSGKFIQNIFKLSDHTMRRYLAKKVREE
jgi:hypothetical protein